MVIVHLMARRLLWGILPHLPLAVRTPFCHLLFLLILYYKNVLTLSGPEHIELLHFLKIGNSWKISIRRVVADFSEVVPTPLC